MLKLPVGISSFEKIRREGYLYVDKTEYIYQMIERGIYYFLSRPRRFGKSLLVSTLRCLFEGGQELFKGLWIYDRWDWTKRYPVIVVDFNDINPESPETLKGTLIELLRDIAVDHNLSLKGRYPGEDFRRLIVGLSKRYSTDVAILIDEYDRPIISHIGLGEEHLEIAKENRQLLKEFYGVLKSADLSRVTRFVLLTGVSQFSRVGVFSDLNNLSDITMDEAYNEIIGITEEEFDRYLRSYIEEFSKKRGILYDRLREDIRCYYNGYRFSDRPVTLYNPFSLFRCLQEYKLKSYWFETGTPTFLVNLIKEKRYYLPHLETLRLPEYTFSQYDLEDLNVEPLLFQTGYLTIKGIEGRLYHLGYPNQEVKNSLLELLFDSITGIPIERKAPFYSIQSQLRDGGIEGFIQTIKGLFSGIAYPVSSKLTEAYFYSVLCDGIRCRSICPYRGIDSRGEDRLSNGV